MPNFLSQDWKYGTGSRGLNSYGNGGNDLITITTTLTEASGHPVTNLIDGRFDWQSGGGQLYTAFTDTDPTDKYIQFDFAEAVTIVSARMLSDFTGYDMGTWKWLGSNDNWATSDELMSDFNLALTPPAAFKQAEQVMAFENVGSYTSLRLVGVSGTMTSDDFGSEIFFLAYVGELTAGSTAGSSLRIFPSSNLPYNGASPGMDAAFSAIYDHDPTNNSGYVGCYLTGSSLVGDGSNYIGLDNKTILNYMIKLQGLRLFTRDTQQAADYGVWQLQYKDSGGVWQDSGDPISFELPSGKSDWRVREAFSGATDDESAEWRVTYVGPQQGTPTTGTIYYVAFHILYEDGSDAPVPAIVDLEAAFVDEASFVTSPPTEKKRPAQLCVVQSGGTS